MKVIYTNIGLQCTHFCFGRRRRIDVRARVSNAFIKKFLYVKLMVLLSEYRR